MANEIALQFSKKPPMNQKANKSKQKVKKKKGERMTPIKQNKERNNKAEFENGSIVLKAFTSP